MKDVNKITLIGRLGGNPILRETKNGKPVARFSLATSRRLARQEGASESDPFTEETEWHQVVAWGQLGEICSKYLEKGSQVYLEGGVRTRKYKGKEGQYRVAYEIHASEVVFLGKPKTKSEGEEEVSEETEAEAVA